uniref:Outer capsid glycoprotein VP7 n=1 Tax=Rotavirus G TaxID=183407 RepID=A0A2R2XE78_9REOV|nr:capsid glycoprotein VP7 [Rotavirus G]
MLTLLSLVTMASAQLVIKPLINSDVCIIYPASLNVVSNFDGNLTRVFQSYSDVNIVYKPYDLSTNPKNVLETVRHNPIDGCAIAAIYILEPELDFVTFYSSENECQQFAPNKTHRVMLPRGREFFTYSQELKFCALDDNLLGIYCDTQLPDTYFHVTQPGMNWYEVTDFPEFNEQGVLFYSMATFYVCERKGSVEKTNVHYFYTEYTNDGTVRLKTNWGNVWKNFKNIAQVVYKVLDLFFGQKGSQPRR